jgi:predicted phosphodiesterase
MKGNKKITNKVLLSLDFHFSIIATLIIVICFSISLDEQREALGTEDQKINNNTKGQDVTLAFGQNHFIAVGDWYCNKETEKTIENILEINPEVIITTGDHVKDEKSAKCWIQMSEKIKDKMKIAIGNHDRDSSQIYKQITNNHNLTKPYYSHDFKNIHFISLSTEHPFTKGSQQYEFIKNDLEKISKNSGIDWIIIHQHKPLYSSKNDLEEAQELRNTYHPLFDKYDVDLVISSHNQYYERTYPLLYNPTSDEYPVFNNNLTSNYYQNPDGIIFLTVGTAGDELQDIEYQEDYYIIQDDDDFGFLDLKLENNGKTIIGEFHTNEGDIIDHFELKQI